MARRGNDPTGEDKAKVRVIFAEVEGNNETVQEALRTMVSAMTRPVRVVSNAGNSDAISLPLQDIQADAGEELQEGNQTTDTPTSDTNAKRKSRGSGAKPDRNAGISLVPDLNFRPEGHPILRDFFAEKSPSTDMEEILVSLYYLQEVMGVERIGPNHIRTALQEVGKRMPLDLKQTIRNMKNIKNWIKFNDIDDLTIATAGNNHVIHDMGKKT